MGFILSRSAIRNWPDSFDFDAVSDKESAESARRRRMRGRRRHPKQYLEMWGTILTLFKLDTFTTFITCIVQSFSGFQACHSEHLLYREGGRGRGGEGNAVQYQVIRRALIHHLDRRRGTEDILLHLCSFTATLDHHCRYISWTKTRPPTPLSQMMFL